MENVRTNTAVFLLLLAATAFFSSSCGEGGSGDLRFVERQPGDLTTQENNQAVLPNSTSSSKVELSDSNQEILKVCILPFINNSADKRLDSSTILIQDGIENKLNEFNRMFEPENIDQGQYQVIAAELGRDTAGQPDEAIAAALRDVYDADLLIFGEILVEDGEIVIKPYIFNYDGKFRAQALSPHKVDTTRIFAFVDIFVDGLINDIIEILQI